LRLRLHAGTQLKHVCAVSRNAIDMSSVNPGLAMLPSPERLGRGLVSEQAASRQASCGGEDPWHGKENNTLCEFSVPIL